MRIGMTMHSGHPRGGVVHAVELANALVRRGHEVTLFAPGPDGSALYRQTQARVVRVPVGAPGPVAEMVGERIGQIASFLRGREWRGIGLWHAHDPISANALDLLATKGAIEGFARTVHHIDPTSDIRIARWQDRAVLGADRVFTVSALWRRALRARFGIDAVEIGNGVDAARFRPAPAAAEAPGAGPVFLAFGGIEARKNTVRVLGAFARFRTRHRRGRLVIAGGASLLDHSAARAAFERVLAASGVEGWVRVPGVVDERSVPALYRSADALLCPSLAEGFGLSPLEAMACGVPAVVSKIAPFDEHFGAADCVWVDPLDEASILDGMEQAVRPDVASRLARRGPAVASGFTWELVAERQIAGYEARQAERPARRCGADHRSEPELLDA